MKLLVVVLLFLQMDSIHAVGPTLERPMYFQYPPNEQQETECFPLPDRVYVDPEDDWLTEHNRLRGLNSVGSLSTNRTMIGAANHRIASIAETGPDGHAGRLTGYSEMIAYNYGVRCEHVIRNVWSTGCLHYTNPDDPAMATGYCTQMLWRDTTFVGCASHAGCEGW